MHVFTTAGQAIPARWVRFAHRPADAAPPQAVVARPDGSYLVLPLADLAEVAEGDPPSAQPPGVKGSAADPAPGRHPADCEAAGAAAADRALAAWRRAWGPA